MRGNLVIRIMGETLAREMMARGVSFAQTEDWLLRWELGCSTSVLGGKTAASIAAMLFELLAESRRLTEQADDDNGR